MNNTHTDFNQGQNLNQDKAVANDKSDPLDRAAEQASALTQRGLNAVHDSARQLRDKASRTGEVTTRYIQNDPLKAVLIAAATGAALMALLGLISRSRAN